MAMSMSGFRIAFEAPTMEAWDSPDRMVWHAWCKAASAGRASCVDGHAGSLEIVEVGDPVGEHGRVVSGERGRRHRLGTARLNVVVILGVATDEHRRVGARPRELFYG